MPSAKTRKKKNKNQASVVEEPEVGNGSDMEGVTSRRPSHGRELSPEPQDVPPQKKKRRKKASTLDVEGEQPDVSNGNMVESPADVDEGRRKSRRKRKPKMADLHYTNELSVEEDDVISDSAPAPAPPAFRQALFSAPPGPSQPMAKVFMEKGRRFQASERMEGPRHAEQMEHLDFMEMQPLWCTKDVALKVHSSFRVLGLFCHGFLAGYAVWNIIVVYVLAGEELSTLSNLLQQYHALAYPAQSLLYLLLAISTVSAFDRVNLAKTSLALRGFLTLDSTAVASALYFIALVLSLSQQMTSDRINLYPEANQTLWPQGDEQRILGPWIAVNLVVALLVGLAWVCISTQPETDYTEEFLMAMEVEEFRHDGMDVKP